MITIQKIEKKHNGYLIEFPNESFIVSDDFIVSNNLYKGKEVDYLEFKKLYELESLFNKTLNYVAFKPRSINEVKNYANDEVAKRLIDLGYLDDYKLTLLIKEHCLNNLKGLNYFNYKLKQRLIDLTLDYEEDQIIDEAFKKALEKTLSYPILKRKQLVSNKLIRDGFNPQKVYEVINTIQNNEDVDSIYLEKFNRNYQKAISKYNDQNKVIKYLLTIGYTYEEIKSYLKEL